MKTNDTNWAVVTGASAGIGEALSLELARKGFDLVLVARRPMKSLADQVEALGQRARCVQADLTKAEDLELLFARCADIPVRLLVNNAGRLVTGSFLEREIEEYAAEVALNVTAPLRIAHHFARRMADSDGGEVVFVGSGGAVGGSPFMANYIGTKSYLHALARGLRNELAEANVRVSVLAPGGTYTEMATLSEAIDFSRAPAMMMMPAEKVATLGVRRLLRGNAFVVPGFMNRFAYFMMTRLMPTAAAVKMMGMMTRRMLVKRSSPPAA